MDPITISIATAVGLGLGQVGKTLIDKGVIEPALQPATDKISGYVGGGYNRAKGDVALQEAVQTALVQTGAPQDADKLSQYLIKWGFDLLQAENNDALRREIAQAALLQFAPQPDLVPERLFRVLRMPPDARPVLAKFLYHLRQELKEHEVWAGLIEQANEDATRAALYQMAHETVRTAQAAERFAEYMRLLLDYYGLQPGKEDGQALQEYLEHIIRDYQHINFVLATARRRDRLSSEAALEAVFVPLHVQDPDVGKRRGRQDQFWAEREDREQTFTINDVLQRYSTFILVGPPGCGKTTLLRHLTLNFAQGEAAEKLGWTGEPLLPILIPLRTFGRFLTDNRSKYTNPAPLALRHFIDDYFAEHDLQLPGDFFFKRLKQGRCLLLLDGLDEVADRDERATVAQFVNQFIKAYQRNGNYFALASRPRGFEQVQHYLERPTVCTVLPLTRPDRDRLVTNLLLELEPNERTRRQNTQDLLANIHHKETVDSLSRNPLFCTTLVLVYKYQGTTLPERRVDVTRSW
ncbi:MAG: NACHT domain-containing protein [Ardenticatenaceae bacterium]|nr:NACHT domain-containing protein [Ardenticatenaceae bacterium]